MTGVLNALASIGGNGQRYTVTIGNTGDNFGYNDASFGSMSPASYGGVTIRVVSEDLSDNVFTVTLSGSRAQSFFRGIEIQGTAGGVATFFTGAATLNDLGTVTAWQWTTASDIWTATSPSTRLVRIF